MQINIFAVKTIQYGNLECLSFKIVVSPNILMMNASDIMIA